MLLAGDIGGTKTVLAIFSVEKGPHHPLIEKTFPSGRYSSLATIVGEFVAEQGVPVEAATFGVAGPVWRGRVQVTNLPWVVDSQTLSQTLNGAEVHLLNDLEATANAVPILDSEDVVTLNTGEPEPEGAIAVIAPGTGLGEAFLVWDGRGYHAYPSEGGHSDFAPTNTFEIELLQYLMDKFGRVSYERVCAGIGIPNIYHFLQVIGFADEQPAVAERLSQATDPTPVIIQAALAGECDLCVTTLNTFVSVLGAEAGNLALKVLSTGGVYLGGGIPPRILPHLQEQRFMEAFTCKGRFASMLARMPIHVILNPRVALFGAAHHAIEMVV